MARTWSVWSWNAATGAHGSWLEVAEGMTSRVAADAAAERKYRAARNVKMDGSAFIVLPRGEKPGATPEELGVDVVRVEPAPGSTKEEQEAGDAAVRGMEPTDIYAQHGLTRPRERTSSFGIGDFHGLPDATRLEVTRLDSEDGQRMALIVQYPGGMFAWALITLDPSEPDGTRCYSTGQQSVVAADHDGNGSDMAAARATVVASVQRQLKRSAG